MVLKDILEEISLRLPADISEDNLIIYINSAIRRFGRYIGKYTSNKIICSSDGKTVQLPEDIKPECIKSVFIGGREIFPEIDGCKDGTYVIEGDGKIRFGGRIKAGKEIKIYHSSYYEAKTRDEAEDNGIDFNMQDMGIDNEYADVLIFSALSDYCEACEDIVAANNYRSKCNEIIDNAMQGRYRKRGKYPTTKDVLNK